MAFACVYRTSVGILAMVFPQPGFGSVPFQGVPSKGVDIVQGAVNEYYFCCRINVGNGSTGEDGILADAVKGTIVEYISMVLLGTSCPRHIRRACYGAISKEGRTSSHYRVAVANDGTLFKIGGAIYL